MLLDFFAVDRARGCRRIDADGVPHVASSSDTSSNGSSDGLPCSTGKGRIPTTGLFSAGVIDLRDDRDVGAGKDARLDFGLDLDVEVDLEREERGDGFLAVLDRGADLRR